MPPPSSFMPNALRVPIGTSIRYDDSTTTFVGNSGTSGQLFGDPPKSQIYNQAPFGAYLIAQDANASSTPSGAVATIACTSTTAGSLLVLCIHVQSSSTTITSVTDSSGPPGGTWLLATSLLTTGSDTEIWYRENIPAGITSVSATMSVGTSYDGDVTQVGGVATSNSLRATNTSTTTASPNNTGAVTALAGDYIIGGVSANSATARTQSPPFNALTTGALPASFTGSQGYLIPEVDGSYDAQWTTASASNTGGAIAAFKNATVLPITEHASAPNVVAGFTSTVTTSPFTPPANSLLICISTVGNTSGAGTLTAPVTDSLGSTWTLLKRANASGTGSNEVWAMNAGASPASRTVTVTGTTGVNATGVACCVKVLLNAGSLAGQTGATASFAGTTAYSISLTTTTVGSLVVGGLVNIITDVGALLPNAITTAWQAVLDNSNTEKYGAWRATNLTVTPGSATYGYTNAATNNQSMAAVEILPPTTAAATNAPAGAALGTGTAGDALIDIDPAAVAATGSGTAADAVAALGANADPALGVGSAGDASVAITTNALEALGTGLAGDATAALTVFADPALGTGTANDATVSFAATAPADPALGVGTAGDATVAITVFADPALGTGLAGDGLASLGVSAGAGLGTGLAGDASVAITVNADVALGTGVANDATVSTATAVNANADPALATGSAGDVTAEVDPNANAALGTGAAFDASVAITVGADVALGVGTAHDATAAMGVNANPALATGSALDALAALGINADVAAGTGTAFDATVSTLPTTDAPAVTALGVGTAGDATVAITFTSGVATGTGGAFDANAANSPTPAAALGVGTAGNSTIVITVNAGAATGVGAAGDVVASYDLAIIITGNPTVTGTALTAGVTGDRTFASVGADTTRPLVGADKTTGTVTGDAQLAKVD